ncbi:MAG: MFS transporter [Dysgonamonadaceae bacterium]|jgi:FHS family L-fucose permease-like MFS transporter|nr:MFS transporter [Dysgonamonadaceae bacterium]
MTSQKQQGNFVAILMMIFLFAMISFVTNLAAPMGVIVKAQFLENSSNANFLGMLGNFANFLAYAFMGIPAGLLLQKSGYKKTALIAIAVGFSGVFVQFLSGVYSSFIVYLLGAFVSGFSVCMLNTVVNPMLNTLGGGGKKGNQLLQIGGSFNSLAGTVTPMLVGALIGQVTRETAIKDVNPVLFIAMGVFAVVFIVLSFVRIPELASTKNVSSAGGLKKDKYSAWSFRHFVLGTIAIFIYVGVEVGIPGTLMLFLSDSKLGILDPLTAVQTAGFVAGTYWFLMLVGRFVGGFVGGSVSGKTMLSVASGIGIVFVLIAIFSPVTKLVSMPVFTGSAFSMTQVPISALFLVLVGLCTSVMWGGIFNLAVEGLGKYVAAASGIFMMMVVGGGILPLIQNFIADKAGYLVSYWVPAVGLAYLLFYAFVGSKNVNKDIPIE